MGASAITTRKVFAWPDHCGRLCMPQQPKCATSAATGQGKSSLRWSQDQGCMHVAQGMACLSNSQLAAVLRTRASLLSSDAADLLPRIDWLRRCVPACCGSRPPSVLAVGRHGWCAARPAVPGAGAALHPSRRCLCCLAGRWQSVRPLFAHLNPICDLQPCAVCTAGSLHQTDSAEEPQGMSP